MNLFSVTFKIIVLIYFVIQIALFRRSVDEAATVHSIYRQMNNEIAETECYQNFPESLKLQMAKVENRADFHSHRSYNSKLLADGLTIFCFILAVVFSFLEIRLDKRGKSSIK